MKSTGIVREIDSLGRIVIPMDIRKQFDLQAKDGVEICVTDEGVLLRKFQPGCSLCGGFDGLKVYKGKTFCSKCLKEMGEL